MAKVLLLFCYSVKGNMEGVQPATVQNMKFVLSLHCVEEALGLPLSAMGDCKPWGERESFG